MRRLGIAWRTNRCHFFREISSFFIDIWGDRSNMWDDCLRPAFCMWAAFLSSISSPIYTHSWELLCLLGIHEGHSSYVCGSHLLYAFGLLQPTGLPHTESVFGSCWNDPLPDLTGMTHPRMQTHSTVTALGLSMWWALQLPFLFENWSSSLSHAVSRVLVVVPYSNVTWCPGCRFSEMGIWLAGYRGMLFVWQVLMCMCYNIS